MASSKTQVFLVDKYPIVRRTLSFLIGMEPDMAVCGEADNAPAAIARMASLKPEVSILDLALKTGSGIELIKQLHVNCPELRILVFSDHHEHFYAPRVLQAGAHGYVGKHEIPEQVIHAVRALKQGELFLSTPVRNRILNKMTAGDSPAEPDPIATLSDRELEVLELLGQGVGSREIAQHLGLSLSTVESHRDNLKNKLKLPDSNKLYYCAMRWVQKHQAPGSC